MSRLPKAFYRRDDVLQISRDLIGKKLVTRFNRQKTSGIIVETEAYVGETDRASHAYGRRRTARTEIMFAPGGCAYVYLCYGIHHLFNVVAGPAGIPHAVLIRALEPVEGLSTMRQRCGKEKSDPGLTAGPGNLTRALGITTAHSGLSLVGNTPVWIEETGLLIAKDAIDKGTRVGVAYAGQDALLPYRFTLRGSRFLSKGKGL